MGRNEQKAATQNAKGRPIPFSIPVDLRDKWKDMTEHEKQTVRLQTSFADLIGNATAGFNYAATLTYPPSFEVWSHEYAQTIAARFRKRYNITFGYKTNPHRKQIYDQSKMAPMVMLNDGDGENIRFHHHLALAKPADMSDADYIEKVDGCWQKCLCGEVGITLIEPIATGGWKRYLSEKLHIGDQEAFDIFNSNIY